MAAYIAMGIEARHLLTAVIMSCPGTIFFFNDTATTEIYTLSLHDALPISPATARVPERRACRAPSADLPPRSEEHTSELQSQSNLVCRLLLEKKKIFVEQLTQTVLESEVLTNGAETDLT